MPHTTATTVLLRYAGLLFFVLASAVGGWLWVKRTQGTPIFEDATLAAGIDYVGITYGAAWGDMDRDGLPDLYLTNHLNEAKLYRNLGGGRFADVTRQYFRPEDLRGDKHGAAWGDFNNDGLDDLVVLTGAERGLGAGANLLFVNRDGRFENVAGPLGVANPQSRARMPLWVDLDKDGTLDLFQGAEKRLDGTRPPFMFLQRKGRFIEADAMFPLASNTAPFCVLTALQQRLGTNLVCRVSAHGLTAQVLDLRKTPAAVASPLPPTAFEDIAAGDFDNDGMIDLYLARKNPAGPVAFGYRSANDVIVDTWIDKDNVGTPMGFRFRTTGHFRVAIEPVWPGDWLSTETIYLGARALKVGRFNFELSPETAHAEGLPASLPGSQVGIYIGRTGRDTWEVRVSGSRNLLENGSTSYQEVAVTITSSTPIRDLTPIGVQAKAEEAPGRLFMQQGSSWVEESDKRGINRRPIAAVNAVAGDFDNDMHLDLFILGSGEIGKQKNLLLLNRGGGRFEAIPNAGGAAGGSYGIGDSVTMVDYDGDGFLDLLIATGGSMGRSEGPPSRVGTYHLYHNRGNGNHWVELDLEGTVSNRNGIGTHITLTAGGVTQVRVQDGGIHYRGQNFQRIHFGLGANRYIDHIEIRWPSGIVQAITGVKADQILHIREQQMPGVSANEGILR